MFIPWKTLRYAGSDGWRVNFIREARAIQETSGWSPWHRGVDPWDMAFAGRLEGIAPPPPGVNAQIQPYVVGRSASTGSALFGDDTSTSDAGVDLKWAATPNTVLDLTYNMDFAQAEVDRQVVNLDRFPVFFPERRTFFLESAGLFHTGLDLISPFYSRRNKMYPIYNSLHPMNLRVLRTDFPPNDSRWSGFQPAALPRASSAVLSCPASGR